MTLTRLTIHNKSQQDAIFLNFILIYNSTCFWQTYCLSSGVLILYSQQLLVFITILLTVCSEVGADFICCEYSTSIKTPDDGQ